MRDARMGQGGRALAVKAGLLILCLVAFSAGVTGQQEEANLKRQLLGTWMLVAMQNEKKVDVLGPHPTGMIVFDANGYFTSQVMRSDLPKFASPNRTEATPQESQVVIRGAMALFGTYTVADARTINLHVLSSLFPNWNGADQKRIFRINGNELELTNLTNSFGDVSVHAFWKRVTPAK